MRTLIIGSLLLFVSTLAVAQQPAANVTTTDHQILWEFDTGG
jgi:hypothetical protein